VVTVSGLSFERRPRLRRPVLLVAFEGWNDAGDAASGALEWLGAVWGAARFATIDLEDYLDYTQERPQVTLDEGVTRRLEWPEMTLSAAPVPGTRRDAVIVVGPEPALRWRHFVAEIEEAARSLGVELVVGLGALLADVAHSRPVPITGASTDPELARSLSLEPSTYEGPTGILGVLGHHLGNQGIATVSLWASVPHYVAQTPSPKAMLALVSRVADLLGTHLDLSDLQAAALAYERAVDEVVDADEDAKAYVQSLEHAEGEERPSAEELAKEVEEFLRRHPGPGAGEGG
jgi:proteasome assembly chaperone (PAC2) family protein